MFYTISKSLKNRARVLVVFGILVMISAGCASGTGGSVAASDAEVVSERIITSINTSDEVGAVKINIQGNTLLTYTSVKQSLPLGIVLYFPGTKLDNLDSEYSSESTVYSSIKTSQQSHDAGYDSRIKILLNKDVDYNVVREGNGLQISLVKPYADNGVAESEDLIEDEEDLYTDEEITESDIELESTDEQDFVLTEEDELLPTGAEGASIPGAGVAAGAGAIAGTAISEDASAADEEIIAFESDGDLEEELIEYEPEADAVIEEDVLSVEPQEVEAEYAGPATSISSVEKSVMDNGVEVSILADGKIENYKTFTIPANDQKAARIVCDIFGTKGIKTKGEQVIPVNSNGVQSIRYFSSPDKMRLVIDTTNENLKLYNASTAGSGLKIKISNITSVEVDEVLEDDAGVSGETIADEDYSEITEDTDSAYSAEGEEVIEEPFSTVEDTDVLEGSAVAIAAPSIVEEEVVPVDEMQVAADSEEIAPSTESGRSWVNRIDFTSETGGKSAFIIGTTQSADYKVTKKDDKTIHLRLNNVRLPKNRQRPLITTRFESAVNRILPVQTIEMKSTALFIIELREAVPYFVDQQGGVLKINFEASSVPPQPEDLAQLPLWKETLSQTPEIKEIEMEAASEVSELEVTPSEVAPEAVEFAEGEEYVEVPDFEEQIEPVDTIEVAETELKSPEAEMEASAGPEVSQGVEIEDEPVEESVSGDGSFVSWARKKKYTGEKISVDFFETDIKNVLRIIRAVSGQNFAIDKDVTGQVTMTLDKPVPWDQVLDLVLKMNMLGMISEGSINRVATLETLRLEEEKRLEYIAAEEKTKVKKKSLEPLFTEYILINYSNADSEVKPLVENVITPERGKLSVDNRTNQLIITDTQEKIEEVKALIKKLDKMTPQVIIEARIVEATTNFSRNLGTEWGLSSNPNYDVYNDTLGGTYGYDVAMNHTVAADSSFGINFTKLTGAQFLLNAKLLAMESQGEGKIVSAPKLITLDNKEATITQGVEYPYTVYNDGEASTSFKKIELKLTVTPHVTADKKIAMKVVIDKNDIATLTDDGPALSTRKIETELLISDGDTIVIGGIIKSTKNNNETGIPLLRNIPYLGWLFKSRTKTSEKQELLIFLSPRIVNFEDSLR